MSCRVVIPTAGIGSRLNNLTNHINKSLVSIGNRPALCHLIEKFPESYEFVIPLGYKGNLVKDFLELVYPNRIFFFKNVDPFDGEGSGLGLSLLSCERYLQEPFIFLSCDTIVKGDIPEPKFNWMGYAKRENLSLYRTLRIHDDEVKEIHDKGAIKPNLWAYIGLAGIYDHNLFWDAMHIGEKVAISQGETYGINAILKSKKVFSNQFEWFDTGNLESLKVARKEYAQPNDPNILEKDSEAIWFVDNNVIKYSNDMDFIKNRVERVTELDGFVPKVYASRPNMYCYKKVDGEILSEIISIDIFESFLKKCNELWTCKELEVSGQERFYDGCLKFYKDKTYKRLNLFYKNFNKIDNAEIINGVSMPSLDSLLDKVDWMNISKGLAGRFHGDLHFENVLYSKKNKSFTFLDWRQDFAGDLSIGDIYYDLSKILHGLIVNHGIISKGLFTASWEKNMVEFSLSRKDILVDCEQRFYEWIEDSHFNLKKVKILTSLIYLNIAALHHYPYSLLLYALGKSMLNDELKS